MISGDSNIAPFDPDIHIIKSSGLPAGLFRLYSTEESYIKIY
jgi:hypothetical protein